MKTCVYDNSPAVLAKPFFTKWNSPTVFVTFFLCMLGSVTPGYSQSCGCDHYIRTTDVTDNSAKIIEWDAGPGGRNVQPGQTICFEATTYLYTIRIVNINGLANNKITIKNCGGQAIIDNKNNGTSSAYHALDIKESEHFILRGDGDPNYPYGIKIAASNGHGLSIAGFSTDFEVMKLEVANTDNSGINSKTDPSCSNRDVSWFVQKNCYFHDNYLHDIGQEGFYVGYTHYPTNTVTCDGVSTTLIAHGMQNIEIYNNQLDYIGWDGIQLGAMISGGKIYGNTIREYATKEESVHIHGIQLSDHNDGAEVFNNKILPIGAGLAGKGCGIVSWADNAKVYNNLLVRTGRDIVNGAAGFSAIHLYDETNSGDGVFEVMNNTIIDPSRYGVHLSWTANSRVNNNIIVQAQGQYITGALASTIISHNVTVTSTTGLGLSSDYNLTSSTPPTIVDAGLNLYSLGVTKDINNDLRPSSGPFDIGADEYGGNAGGKIVKINFRGTDPAPADAEWNDWNAMPTTVSPAPTLTNINYTDGTATPYTATLTGRFSGANGLGVNAAGTYPATVTQTNWYIHNISSTPGAVTLSGLDNTKKYSFKFFGSRRDVNGTIDRTTEFTIGSTTVTLNASNNTTVTANIDDVSPVNGTIVFTVKYGPGAEFGYLNALEMTEVPVQVVKNIKVNFRGTTPAFSDPQWNDWNVMPTSTNPPPAFSDLKYSDGASSNYTLTVTTAFSGANGLGMEGTGIYPSAVMETNWYVHNNSPNSGVFSISGLDNNKTYSFRFFGSREDPTGTTNRNTNYTIGSTTVTLNASNNTTQTVDINNVTPTNGSITVSVKYGTGVTFGYLNAMEIFEHSGSGGSSVAMTEEPVQPASASENSNAVTAHPVPFNNRIALTFGGKIDGKVSVLIMDIHGRHYFYHNDYAIPEGGIIDIDLSNADVRKGLHVIRVQSSSGYSKTIHVVKE